MKKLGIAGFSTLFCLASALPVMAQAQPNATELKCNEKVRASMAKPEDMTVFNDFVNDPTCKDSMYRENVFYTTFQKLVTTNKWKDAYELAGRYEKEVPKKTDQIMKYVAGNGLTAASQLGDLDKILEMGEKVLVIDAMDINALVIVSNALPEKYPTLTDQAAKDKNLNRAQDLAKQLIAMKRVEALPEQTWQQSVVGPAHAVLGFVALQRTQYPEASTEYEQAVKITPKDQMSWFRGGLAKTYIAIAFQKTLPDFYAAENANLTPGPERDAAIAKREAAVKEFTDKREAAMESLATAAAMGGPVGDAAKTQLKNLYELAHNGTEGLDEYITKHKIP